MATIHGKKIKVFALNSNKQLAKDIADYIGVELSECEVKTFADGEVQININETVRGHEVFVVQTTCSPVNDHYMELLIMIDALKRASAYRINVIMPYYGYSRQDRKARARQPISAKLIADLLQAAGAHRVLCLDLHADQIQGFFNIPIDNFFAMPIFAEYFLDKGLDDIVVVSPDHGGTTRARRLALALNAPIAIADKRRPKPNQAEIMNMIGEVKGKNCILIDDMVDTAGTLTIVANYIKSQGAKNVYACCTHALLSGTACDKINDSEIIELVCTDSLDLTAKKAICPKIVTLSIAPLIGQGIMNIIDDKPVSGLFDYERK